jgi:RHS repeat-associated protein
VAANKGTLRFLLALVMLCASASAHATFNRPLLTPTPIDRRELPDAQPRDDRASDANARLLLAALDRAMLELPRIRVLTPKTVPEVLTGYSEEQRLHILRRVKPNLASGVLALRRETNLLEISRLGQELHRGEAFQAQPFAEPFTRKFYVRERWYDPQTGTWLTPDPMGYDDSANLYAYAGGDPVNGSDPTGLAASVSKSGVIIGIRPDGTRYRIEAGTDPVEALRILESDPDIRTAADQEEILRRARMAIPYSSAPRAGECFIGSGKPNDRAYTHLPSNGKWVQAAFVATTGLPAQSREQEIASGVVQIASAVAITAGNVGGQIKAARSQGGVGVGIEPVFETENGIQIQKHTYSDEIGQFRPTITVYRVEGAANARVTIGPNGNVTIDDGQSMLFLNFGDTIRAQQFFAKRFGQGMFGASTKSFEVPRWFMLELEQEAVSERAERRVPGAPLVVDETKAPNQYGLRPSHVNRLRGVIIPGSGKDQ